MKRVLCLVMIAWVAICGRGEFSAAEELSRDDLGRRGQAFTRLTSEDESVHEAAIER